MKKRVQKRVGRGVRLIDVAKEASCSTASVSRVLNEPGKVKPDIRDRVFAAMRKLNYRPNGAARALRSHRTRIMGIVIPTLNHAIYAVLVEALQQKLATHGYSLLVATSEYDPTREEAQARLLVDRGVDGLAFVGGSRGDQVYEFLEGIPYVNTYVYSATSPHPCVGFDNRGASFDLAKFLVGLGHRQFGVISAVLSGNDRASERVAGVRFALEQNGLHLPENAVYECPYSILGGREGMRYLLSLRPAPTAIVCGNDVLAMGALVECRSLGVSIPEEISIVGFDNLEFAAHLEPALTTMEVPAFEMGVRAAELLLNRAAGKARVPSVHLEPNLIVRRTTGRAPSPNVMQSRYAVPKERRAVQKP